MAAHRVHADAVRVYVVREGRERRRLPQRGVGIKVPVERVQHAGDAGQHAVLLDLVEDGEQHLLLAVDAVEVAAFVDIFAHAQIVQNALPIEMRRARAITAPRHLEREFQVIVHAANRVDQLFDRGHGDRIVIVHRNAAEHPACGLTGFQKTRTARRIKPASTVDRGIEFIDSLDAGDVCIGVSRKRDEVHAVLVEVDGHDHHHVRVVFVLAVPGFSLLRIVYADEQHVDDILHHAGVRLCADHLIGVERRRRCRGARRGR
ncbi:hypothetical protein SDC9_124262 [bioreactor metagenome]|uniref:Uncharacterized protein n=1 Tax=bioreactor metagenome TaxID=1076179 RepID=A0A645CKI3_9ZZZZ